MAKENKKEQEKQGSKKKDQADAVKKPRTPRKTKAEKEKEEQIRTTKAKARMLKAMEKHLGIVSPALKAAKVSRTAHYEWIKNDPDYAQSIVDVEGLALDTVEDKLMEHILGYEYFDTHIYGFSGKVIKTRIKKKMVGDIKAVIFYLETKGKDRGYVKRLESKDIPADPYAGMSPEDLLARLDYLKEQQGD